MATDVEVTFGGNNSSLRQALQEIREELRGTKESVSTLTSQFANLYFTLQGAVAGIKGAFAAFSGVASSAAEMEQVTLAFRVMLGDAEKAASYVANLKKFAAQTPFEFGDISAAAKTLLAMGTEAAKSTEVIRKLGDVAAVSGKPLKDLAFLYAKAQNAGLTNEVAESLEMQGVPLRRLLAEIKGMSFSEVFAGISARQFGIEDLDLVLDRLTGSGGLLENMTLLQSQTAGGVWSTLLDNIKAVAVELGTPINAAVVPILQDIISYLSEIQPQVAAFAEGVASSISTAADVLGPFVSGLASLVETLGGAETVIASVVGGMLLYIGSTKTAAASTTSLRGTVSSLVGAFKGLSMSSVVSAVQTGLNSIRAVVSSTMAGIKIVWSVAWSTLATITRAAMLAVKAAIVSTGIGLIIVGIGEALGALYEWFSGNAEAAREAAAATRQFERSLKDLEKRSASVKTEEDFARFIDSLNEQIDELRAKREDAYAEGDYDKGDFYTKQLNQLWAKKAHYKETLPLQIEAARHEEKAAASMKEQAKAAEELQKKLEAAKDKLAEYAQKQRETERERYLSGLKAPLQIQMRLNDAGGFKSIEELRKAMDELRYSNNFSVGDEETYQRLCATYNKVVEIQEKEKERTKEIAKATAAYDGQVALLTAQAAGNQKLALQLTQQQRIVQLTEEYRRKGLADAEARAKRIVELEQQAQSHKAQQDYTNQIALLEAEISGNERKLAKVREEQRIVQLTEQYRSQGLTNAKAKAEQLVALERKAAEAQKVQNKLAQQALRISDSMAQVGGGGRSVVIGGPMLSESKKHTQLLKEVGATLKQKPTFKLSGNLTAVLGR